jgi:hypothetical protein
MTRRLTDIDILVYSPVEESSGDIHLLYLHTENCDKCQETANGKLTSCVGKCLVIVYPLLLPKSLDNKAGLEAGDGPIGVLLESKNPLGTKDICAGRAIYQLPRAHLIQTVQLLVTCLKPLLCSRRGLCQLDRLGYLQSLLVHTRSS